METQPVNKKRLCKECNSKFYEVALQPPIICPVCNTEYVVNVPKSDGLSNDQKKTQDNKIPEKSVDETQDDINTNTVIDDDISD